MEQGIAVPHPDRASTTRLFCRTSPLALLALAAIPLAIVLFVAQRDFAKNMATPSGGYQSDEY